VQIGRNNGGQSLNITGTAVLAAAREQLADLYSRTHGTPPAEGVVVNGTTHFPKTAMEVVDLHINDAPQLRDGFSETFAAFAFNLPNFSRFASVFPVPLRQAVARTVLTCGGDVAETDIHFATLATEQERSNAKRPGRLGLNAFREMLANIPEVRERDAMIRAVKRPDDLERQFVGSPSWNFYTAGLREGLHWMAEMSRESPSLRAYVNTRLGEPAIGSVDGEKVWAFVDEVVARKIPWLGQATGPNFLKDAGLVEFVKPDVHTIRIVKALDARASRVDAEDWRAEEAAVAKAMIRYANEAGVWPRAMDRALWLVGSGFFHYQAKSPLPGGDRRATELVQLVEATGARVAA
jgi:hypothetical protein